MGHHDNIDKKKNVKKYKRLSPSERIKIEQLYNEGYNMNHISKSINRDYNTVKREIQRNGTKNQPSLSAKRQGIKKYRYNANTAQKKRDERYLRPKTPEKFDSFIKYCNKNLKAFVTLEEDILVLLKIKGQYMNERIILVFQWMITAIAAIMKLIQYIMVTKWVVY